MKHGQLCFALVIGTVFGVVAGAAAQETTPTVRPIVTWLAPADQSTFAAYSTITFQGSPVSSTKEFRDALLKQGDEVVRTVAEKLLTYALGRGLTYHDAPLVRDANLEPQLRGGRRAKAIIL